MKIFIYLLLILLPLIISCNEKRSGNYNSSNNGNKSTGKVIAIIDGDTYDILMEGDKTVRVRMEGIDAPEKGMPFSKVAKKYLGSLCFGKFVRLEGNKIDNHGRRIAFSYLEDGTELSHEMIKAGLAWHFKKYNSDSDLANLENTARNAKLGLWSDKDPMAPWVNRKLHHEGISTQDSFDIHE